MSKTRRWLREWYVTLRYGSRFTPAGRRLRAALRDGDDLSKWVEVSIPPSAAIDCRVAGCRHGGHWNDACECPA